MPSAAQATAVLHPAAPYGAGMGFNRHNDTEVEACVDGTWWPGWLDEDQWRRIPSGGRPARQTTGSDSSTPTAGGHT